LIEHHATPHYLHYHYSTIGYFQAFHQHFYGAGLANDKIVTATFCGNFLDDLDDPDDPFKVRRPNLEIASQAQGEGLR
jgi:hypothetical protein